MNIELIRATVKDAAQLWEMQVKSFQALLDKYQDYETSPASEPLEKMIHKGAQCSVGHPAFHLLDILLINDCTLSAITEDG